MKQVPGNPKAATPHQRTHRAPRQSRAHASTEALLDAGLECLERQGPSGLSVAQVATQAGSSVGSFYFRFQDKETFVRAVLQRGAARIAAEVEAMIEHAEASHATPAELIGAFASLSLIVLERHRHMFAMFIRRGLDNEEAWEGVARFGPQVLDRLVQALARYPEMAKIPDWQQKVRFSVHAARAAVVARYYNPHAPLPKDRRELAYCMRRLVLRYVGLPDAADA